jgi:hypothetical protein
MVKYCKKYQCIEFPNEGDYYLPIEFFKTTNEYGINEGYYHLLEKSWFNPYRKATQKILLDLGFNIDFKFNEDFFIKSIKYINKIF